MVRADIGIMDGRIARLGRINSADATRTIDSRGQIVAAGFIDDPILGSFADDGSRIISGKIVMTAGYFLVRQPQTQSVIKEFRR